MVDQRVSRWEVAPNEGGELPFRMVKWLDLIRYEPHVEYQSNHFAKQAAFSCASGYLLSSLT